MARCYSSPSPPDDGPESRLAEHAALAHYTSIPYADVLAYMCIPRDAPPPYAAMVCLQGHSTGMHNSIAVDYETNTKPIEVAGDRDFALGCLRRGIAALCIEQRSFGERKELVQEHVSPHGCHDATMHALMLGRTLIGERVYDIDRAIDYLAGRGDADAGRPPVGLDLYARADRGRHRRAGGAGGGADNQRERHGECRRDTVWGQ